MYKHHENNTLIAMHIRNLNGQIFLTHELTKHVNDTLRGRTSQILGKDKDKQAKPLL